MEKTRRRRRSRSQWQALLARAEQSELSVANFCRNEDISAASFYQWRQRLAAGAPSRSDAGRQQAGEATPFVDLGTLGAAGGDGGANAWTIELQLGGDVVLRLRRG
jgi:hypothetical protein